MALQVRNSLRTNSCQSLTNPSFIHLFSTKSVDPSEPNHRHFPDEIRKNLSEFRPISAGPPPPPWDSAPPSSSSQNIPLEELFKRNAVKNSDNSNESSDSMKGYPGGAAIRKNMQHLKSSQSRQGESKVGDSMSLSAFRSSLKLKPSDSAGASSSTMVIGGTEKLPSSVGDSDSMKGRPGGALSFQAIHKNLQHPKSSRSRQSESEVRDSMSLSAFRSSLKLKPSGSAGESSPTMVIGGTEKLPSAVFGKEMMERSFTGSPVMNTEFVKTYSLAELGEKLRKLSPVDGGKSFSLAEWNERLMKLREMEEMETGPITLETLREYLENIRISGEEQEKQSLRSRSRSRAMEEMWKSTTITKLGESWEKMRVSAEEQEKQPSGLISSAQELLESLQHPKSSRSRQSEGEVGDSMSLSAFRSSLKVKPSDSAGASSSTMAIGGTEKLPSAVFGKKMLERSSTGSPVMNTESGEKPVDGGKSFSWAEWKERLMKWRWRRGD